MDIKAGRGENEKNKEDNPRAVMSTDIVTVGASSVVNTSLPWDSSRAFSKTGVCRPVSPPSPTNTHRTVELAFKTTSGWLHLQQASEFTRGQTTTQSIARREQFKKHFKRQQLKKGIKETQAIPRGAKAPAFM